MLEDRKLFDLARAVEQTALRVLDEVKPGRNLKTNVEFYTALVLQSLGLAAALVRGDVRVRPRRGLVRARHRAARRGPPDPPAVGVRRAAGAQGRALVGGRARGRADGHVAAGAERADARLRPFAAARRWRARLFLAGTLWLALLSAGAGRSGRRARISTARRDACASRSATATRSTAGCCRARSARWCWCSTATGATTTRAWRYGAVPQPRRLRRADRRLPLLARARSACPTTLGASRAGRRRGHAGLGARRSPSCAATRRAVRRIAGRIGGAVLAAASAPSVAAVVADCRVRHRAARARGHLRALGASAGAGRAPPSPRWSAAACTGRDPGALDAVAAAASLRDRAAALHPRRTGRPHRGRARPRRCGAPPAAKDALWIIADAGHNEGWQRIARRVRAPRARVPRRALLLAGARARTRARASLSRPIDPARHPGLVLSRLDRRVLSAAAASRSTTCRSTPSVFDTVELDTTFYHPPRPTIVRSWARHTPDDVPLRGQGAARDHARRAAGRRGRADGRRSCARSSRSGEKLGPLLVQLPAEFARDARHGRHARPLPRRRARGRAARGRVPRPFVARRRDLRRCCARAASRSRGPSGATCRG